MFHPKIEGVAPSLAFETLLIPTDSWLPLLQEPAADLMMRSSTSMYIIGGKSSPVRVRWVWLGRREGKEVLVFGTKRGLELL